jgi:hypothetical protein
MMNRAKIQSSKKIIATDRAGIVAKLAGYVKSKGITAESSCEHDFDAFVEAMDECWESIGLASWMPSEVEGWKLAGEITAEEEYEWLEIASSIQNELHQAMIENK